MIFDIMTLFPEVVRAVLDSSITGRAQAAGYIKINTYNIRDYSKDKHRRVDDTPYGGGRGMLMAPQPIYDCYQAILKECAPDEIRRVIYLSPKGKVFTQETAKRFAGYDRLILLCGHYEGIDQRVLDLIVDEYVSIGDYVLTGGEIPACVVVDCVSRLIDGVLPAAECYESESLTDGLLEYPQYTRPPVFMGIPVPEVLLSGNHAKIDNWRRERAIEITRLMRPDLLGKKVCAADDESGGEGDKTAAGDEKSDIETE